jgi:diguanylate cyclase (GGDEF)-like protein/PAS domain S-box-containing protein
MGVTIAACVQTASPMIFLIYPLLALMLLRLGLGWSTLALLFVASICDLLTLRGLGPFAALRSANPVVLLDFFVATGVVILYSVSLVQEKQKTTERRLQDIVALHDLVSEKSRDAIILDDWSGHHSQGSSAIKNIDGWKPQALSAEDGLEQVHPDDRPKVADALNELHSGSESVMVECRIRKQSGEYIWVEVNLCAVRDPRTGNRSGILNFVRDISERKKAEKLLEEAYQAVETLAITDALTGLANRRQFDHYLATEWRRGLRDGNPISLMMIDVDLFKSYNDTYGHPSGDSCLRQVAEVVQAVVARPGDLVARFGGEEFTVILPNTGSEGALHVANNICDVLRLRKQEHSNNPLGILTISVGCATMMPSLDQIAINLIELADEALYTAKRNGRNQVCSYDTLATTGTVSRTRAF